jgi:hypothetical protein
MSVAPAERRSRAELPRSRCRPKVKWAGRAPWVAACRMRAVQSVAQLTAAAPRSAPDHAAAGRVAVLLPEVLPEAVAVARTELQA